MRIFEGYTWIQKVVLIIWLLMVLTIPFHKVLSSPLLILSFIIILFSGNYRSRWMYFTTHKRWMIFAALYLLVGYAYLRSTDKQEALRELLWDSPYMISCAPVKIIFTINIWSTLLSSIHPILRCLWCLP